MEDETLKTAARIALGGALIFACISHLSFASGDFPAQKNNVKRWVISLRYFSPPSFPEILHNSPADVRHLA